jgi:ATP-dependent DNA helicase RecG
MTENERVEYKKSLAELKEGLISIVATLNKHGGGELWFGLRSDGTPVGLDISEKTLRDLSQAIAAHIEPKIYPSITAEKLYGKGCIRVAFSGGEMPYFAYGRAYMRVADEDRLLSAKELENIILDKNHEARRWDNKPGDASLTDIDEEKVRKFVGRAKLSWDTLDNVLEKLGVMQNGKLLNSALLFFGKKPAAKLRCAVFASTTAATIIDQHDYEGDILELIEEAQKYALKNIHIGMRLEGLYRVDVPEISTEAMREAIINAFCHRDYWDPDEVRVAVFKDRVEIRNPGKLFGGLTVDALRQGNVSMRRNPLIADMLKRIHMVEGWGRGMPLILNKEPGVKFKEVAHLFIAAFGRPSFTEGYGIGNTGNVERNLPISPVTPEKEPEKKPEKTPEKICRLLLERADITIAEISVLLTLNPRTVERHLTALRKAGRIRRIGADRGGKWEVMP